MVISKIFCEKHFKFETLDIHVDNNFLGQSFSIVRTHPGDAGKRFKKNKVSELAYKNYICCNEAGRLFLVS